MKTGTRRPEPDDWTGKQTPASDNEKNDPADRLGVTLSGLLNVLDGFHTPENVLFVMTTNKMETLDPALLRPGRVDYRLFMGGAVESQKVELYCKFFPNVTEIEAREFAQVHYAETMAEFQGLLLALERWEERLDLVNVHQGRGMLV
jgi:chaperone BCS1